MLEDNDLSRMMVAANPDGTPGDGPGLWAVGGLVAVDRDESGGAAWVVEHQDGDQLPLECCAQLPHDVTGARS
jgi:hypothetical protein